DDQAHAVFVGLVANVGNAFDLAFVDQLGDTLLQGLLVYLVRKLVDDDGLSIAFLGIFEVRLGAHDDAAAAGAIALAHAAHAVDDAARGKVGRRDELDQLVDGAFGVAQAIQAAVYDLGQIVRRDIGSHAYGNARTAVDQKVGQPRGQHQRLLLAAVVVGAEVDGFLVDVGQQLVGDARQPDFGVTHGGRAVAVDGAEVALPVDQHIAQGKILRHANDRVIDGRVTMRVVLTDDVADDTRRFLVGPVPVVVELVHGVEHAAMHRLETVTHVGQGPPHDHAHGVVEVAATHLLFQRNWKSLLGVGIHRGV